MTQITTDRTELEKVRDALDKIRGGLNDTDGDYYDGWTYEYHLIAKEALAILDKMLGEV
jgi:hypothetical protein